jgi:phosphatidate cytidylyltransferase
MKADLGLRNRLIVIDIIIPILLIFIILGGWPFTIFIAAILGIATWELWRLFKNGGYSPSLPVMVFFVVAAVVLRHIFQFQWLGLLLMLLIFAAMTWHVIAQQKGAGTAAVDFVITIGGAVYLGCLGSYVISTRAMDNGLYWLLLTLPIISIADTGAYLVGRKLGKHKILSIVSPKKSWEGYLGGVLTGILGGWGLAALWHIHVPSILPIYGVIFGAVISILAPMGDFGESMIKRQFNSKDSGKALLDHGGFLDRMDSTLWAVAIGYYLILLVTG